jgi:hypothetical protein
LTFPCLLTAIYVVGISIYCVADYFWSILQSLVTSVRELIAGYSRNAQILLQLGSLRCESWTYFKRLARPVEWWVTSKVLQNDLSHSCLRISWECVCLISVKQVNGRSVFEWQPCCGVVVVASLRTTSPKHTSLWTEWESSVQVKMCFEITSVVHTNDALKER